MFKGVSLERSFCLRQYKGTYGPLHEFSRRVTFCYPPDRGTFTYYTDDHADLLSKFVILQNLGLVHDIRHNDVPRFAFEEGFAEYLTLQ
jgi:hypothetical protein